MSKVKGAPRDVKANAGEDVSDGNVQERTYARPPDPSFAQPRRINVRRMTIRRKGVENHGPTRGCPGYQKVSVLSCIVTPLTDDCRESKDKLVMQDATRADRVVLTKTRHEGAFARLIVEHDERDERDRDKHLTNKTTWRRSRRND